jgi:pyrimidine deaminase RibD-like protein
MANLNPKLIEVNASLSRSNLIKKVIELSKNSKNTEKTDPKVGVIIWFPKEKILVKSHRENGNQYGSHAEEIAINFANSPKKHKLTLSEATIFTTLEPCTHRAKDHSCSNLILKNQIKNVFIGMLDPDQRVRGSGACLLSERTSLGFFSPKNLREIHQINADFIESRKFSLAEYCKVLLSKKEIYEMAGNLIESNPQKKRILLGALHGFARGRIPEESSSKIFHQKFSSEMHRCTLDFNWEVKELYNITTIDRYHQIHSRLSSRMSAENYEVRAFCNRGSLPILCPLIIGDQDAFLSLEDDKFYQVNSGYHLHGKNQIQIAKEYFFKLWNLKTFKIWEDGKMNSSEMERIKKQIGKNKN